MKTIKGMGMTVEEAKVYCKDRTLKQLSEEFGMTELQVKNRLSYHAIYWKRVYTKKVDSTLRDEMIRVLTGLYSYEQIGRAFGLSKQRIEQIKRGEPCDIL